MTDEIAQKIKSRINKLIALATSNPESAEAQAALKKAMELMAEHGVSDDDLTKPEIIERCIEPDNKKFPGWQRALMGGICSVFGVLFIRTVCRGAKDRFRLFGQRVDVQIAEYFYHSCVAKIEFHTQKYLRGLARNKREAGRSYRYAAARTLCNRLHEMYRTYQDDLAATGGALVAVDDRIGEAEKFFEDMHNGGRKIPSSSQNLVALRQYHARQGEKQAEKMTLNKGVGADEQSPKLLAEF